MGETLGVDVCLGMRWSGVSVPCVAGEGGTCGFGVVV